MSAYLQFDQVSKHFPGVIALGGVSFEAHAGAVHGLLGENGAGKSTLLKILGGQYRPDGGRLLLNGREVHFGSSSDAIAAGVAIIHQELQYVPELTVAENVLLGRMPTRFGILDKPAAHKLVSERLRKIGVDLAKIDELEKGDGSLLLYLKLAAALNLNLSEVVIMAEKSLQSSSQP